MKKVMIAALALVLGTVPSSAQFNGYGPYGGGGAGGLMPWNGMGGYMPFLGMMNRYEGQFMANTYSNAFYGPAYGAGNYGQGGNGAWGYGSVYTPSTPFRW